MLDLCQLNLDDENRAYRTDWGATYQQDAGDFLTRLPDESVDLVLTSPPFALTRSKEYPNPPAALYLDWLRPFCVQIRRVLKPTGSFVLDLGGAWQPGRPVRSLYQFEVAVDLSRLFPLAQEFYWHNPAKLPTPAEWVTIRRIRVKDAVNVIWWFAKTDFPKAHNRKVLIPYSASMETLLAKGYKARKRPSGHVISNQFATDNGGAIPSNLLAIANTESNSAYLRACRARQIKPHPARFPAGVVEFFLRFLTDENDLVYDPFAGSNTTGMACEAHSRRWLATEIVDRYVAGSRLRFSNVHEESP